MITEEIGTEKERKAENESENGRDWYGEIEDGRDEK